MLKYREDVKMITPKEIERKTMSEAKRKEAKNSIFGFYIGRPITYVLTVPFLYTNISPNVITVWSIIFAIGGYICLSMAGTVKWRLIGLLLIFLWNMGDGIDGNIARYKGLKSANGDLLDTLGGYLAMVLIVLGMGNAAYNDSEGTVLLAKIFPVALSGISAVMMIIPRLLMHRKLAMKADEEAEKLKDKSTYSLAKIIMLNICDPAGFQEIIMLFCIILHLNTEFTIGYFIINFAVMVYSIKGLMD